MNVSYQYNKKAGKSIRLLSFICSECKQESIVVFNGQGKYACTNCGWKIELVKESVQIGHILLKKLSLPLISSQTLNISSKQNKPRRKHL